MHSGTGRHQTTIYRHRRVSHPWDGTAHITCPACLPALGATVGRWAFGHERWAQQSLCCSLPPSGRVASVKIVTEVPTGQQRGRGPGSLEGSALISAWASSSHQHTAQGTCTFAGDSRGGRGSEDFGFTVAQMSRLDLLCRGRSS